MSIIVKKSRTSKSDEPFYYGDPESSESSSSSGSSESSSSSDSSSSTSLIADECITSDIPIPVITVISNTEISVVVPELPSDIDFWRLDCKKYPSNVWFTLTGNVTTGPIVLNVDSCSHYTFRWVGIKGGD